MEECQSSRTTLAVADPAAVAGRDADGGEHCDDAGDDGGLVLHAELLAVAEEGDEGAAERRRLGDSPPVVLC